ncbi:MAG TPA: glycine betaine ABC transporter substrate-binding protein [Solirubrobacterales bacterium]|nr:glycine betaine ABC transporter substrate-binding protein [Solirubrobacterales bacterium]
MISSDRRLRALFALLAAAVLALGVAACGDDDDDDGGDTSGASGSLIESNPDNSGVDLTVGSKNFTEALILGEIYAQALEAAGYNVQTDLNLGSEQVALEALQAGEISGYPEYTSTALTSFFNKTADQVPADSQEAYADAQAELEKDGLTAFAPTPFADSNAVGTLTTTAEELGVTTISDLKGKSQDLVLAGSPECRQRVDCLVGLQDVYGLQFKEFLPVDIELRYPVLDDGQADLSILFTSDANLATGDKYTLLEDDMGIFPAGNVIWITDQATVDEAGPDYQATIEKVQEGLTLEVMQELNSRVDIDKDEPAAVATQYLQESGYIE